jgi:hypothetical protein
MPLTRCKEEVLTTMMGVKVLMRDSDTEVACRAERKMLRYRFDSRDRDGDEKAFELHREAIEKAASDKFDAGMVESHTDATVIVTDEDMASPLSRKM